ncbi:MAG: DUF3810 family protein, partial [Flavobacteriaceae bacterium]|nr:DUF3810 family protein [Flavobacteriaceae bacterium]
MHKEKRNKILTIFLFVQIGLVYLLSKFPIFVDQIYSNGIYLYLSAFFRTIFGWIPFSVGDIFYFILIILIIRFLITIFRRKFKNRKQIFYQIFASFSVFYFFFYFFWGLNYSRPPITESLQLKNDEYNIEKLKSFTDKLLYKIKDLQFELTG